MYIKLWNIYLGATPTILPASSGALVFDFPAYVEKHQNKKNIDWLDVGLGWTFPFWFFQRMYIHVEQSSKYSVYLTWFCNIFRCN